LITWARTATPSTGVIWSVDPPGKVIETVATSGPTATAVHQTGAPSTTPKAPEARPIGSVPALAVVATGAGSSARNP